MADLISVHQSSIPKGRKKIRWGRSLGLSSGGTMSIVRQVERGFPYSAIIRFHQVSGIPVGRIAELAQIPPRTLIRRKARGRLDSNESERLLRISTTFEKALELFAQDRDAAWRWLTTPRMELGDLPPIELARTEVGARAVEDLIARLEHGVFS